MDGLGADGRGPVPGASDTMVGVRKLIFGLVVLLGLAVLADFGAAAWSEYRVSRALREGGVLESDPAVTIHGFPFLLQARDGHYENVEIVADNVHTDLLGDITVEANLIGAHAEAGELLDGSIRSVPVDLLYGRVMLDATELGQLYGIPDLQVSAPPASKSDGTGGSGGSGPTTAGGVVLTGTVPVGPVEATVSVQADLVLDGDRVHVVASDLYFGPEGRADFSVPDVLKPAVLGLFTTTIEPQNLPFGVRPTFVEARGSRIVIEGEARDVVIDLQEVQTPHDRSDRPHRRDSRHTGGGHSPAHPFRQVPHHRRRRSAGTHEPDPALAAAGVGDGVPVVLHFSAPWCGPCAAVRRVVVQVLDREPGRAREVELDLDENPVLARKLGVLSLPTTFVFDGDGRERFRASGVPSADDLRTTLSSL